MHVSSSLSSVIFRYLLIPSKWRIMNLQSSFSRLDLGLCSPNHSNENQCVLGYSCLPPSLLVPLESLDGYIITRFPQKWVILSLWHQTNGCNISIQCYGNQISNIIPRGGQTCVTCWNQQCWMERGLSNRRDAGKMFKSMSRSGANKLKSDPLITKYISRT